MCRDSIASWGPAILELQLIGESRREGYGYRGLAPVRYRVYSPWRAALPTPKVLLWLIQPTRQAKSEVRSHPVRRKNTYWSLLTC